MDIPYYTSKMISVYDPYNPPLPDPDPDRQYMWSLFATHPDRQTTGTTTFQSSYPPYAVYEKVDETHNYIHVCGFIKGNDSLRVTMYWDNFSTNEGMIPHPYLHGAVVGYSEAPELSVQALGQSVCSYLENGSEELVLLTADEDFTRIIKAGKHEGAPGVYVGTCPFFNQNSDPSILPEDITTGDSSRIVHLVIDVKFKSNGYPMAYITVGMFGGFRIIHGKPFSSILEWFNWCKAH